MPENNQQKPNFYSLYQTVGEIKGKVDAMDRKLDTATKNHEERINTLENENAIIKTKAGIVGGFFGFLTSIIVAAISWFKIR